jgi:two-component system chemotaxis response regulator CheB
MPESALRYVEVDHCVPLDEIPPLLDRVVREEAEEEGAYPVPDEMELESKLAGLDPTTIETAERSGELSAFTCPEYSGPLYEIQDGQLIRFRCRVGHARTASSMLDEKTDALEAALYVALNSLEEGATMAQRLVQRARSLDQEHAARRFEERAREGRQRAPETRRVLMEGTTEPPADAV